MNHIVPKEVFTFFKKLEKNNNRDWFNENKPEFKAIETKVKAFYNTVLERLNTQDEIDKLKIFRIYRDVRFSKNKLPYKTHFGGSFHRTKPKLRGGYYIHIQPNNESFIATGFWEPAKEDLLRIRKEFEMDDSDMRDILNDKKFKSIYKRRMNSGARSWKSAALKPNRTTSRRSTSPSSTRSSPEPL